MKKPVGCGDRNAKLYPRPQVPAFVLVVRLMAKFLRRCGKNYGWAQFEGSRCQEAIEDDSDFESCNGISRSGFESPWYEYCHDSYDDTDDGEDVYTNGVDICRDRQMIGSAVIGACDFSVWISCVFLLYDYRQILYNAVFVAGRSALCCGGSTILALQNICSSIRFSKAFRARAWLRSNLFPLNPCCVFLPQVDMSTAENTLPICSTARTFLATLPESETRPMERLGEVGVDFHVAASHVLLLCKLYIGRTNANAAVAFRLSRADSSGGTMCARKGCV